MTDLATLDIKVTSEQVPTAKNRLDQLSTSSKNAESATRSLSATTGSLAGYLKAAAAALASWKLAEYIREVTLLAARVETLGVVMRVVGNNAGYTGAQMDMYTNQVKKMGITTQESMSSLIKMAGAQMDLSKASQLARVAQDAAVIGNINSSEAFGKLIAGIQKAETEILETIGINVKWEDGYKQLAATLGKTTDQLSAAEKMTARTNQALAFGANIAGTYAASMGTAGKMAQSMARLQEEIKRLIGTAFTPTYTDIIEAQADALKMANDALGENKDLVAALGRELVNPMGLISDFRNLIVGTAQAVGLLIEGLKNSPGSITLIGVAAYGAVGGVAGLTAAYATLTSTIAASMAANPIGWVAAGIAAIYLAARPAVEAIDAIGYAYAGLHITGKAAYDAEMKRAAEADKKWEDFKKKAIWMYKEGGIKTPTAMNDPEIKRLEVAAAAAENQRKKEEEASRKAEAKKGEDLRRQWKETYSDLRKEIEMLNPAMTEEARAILEVTNKYEDLMGKKGADLVLLSALKMKHLEVIETHYETAAAIESAKKEMDGYVAAQEAMAAAEKEMLAGRASDDKLLRALEQERQSLKLTNRELFIQQESRKKSAWATEDYAEEVRKAAGALYDEREAIEAQKGQAESWAKVWQNSLERIDGLFVDLWERGLQGFSSFADGVKDTFKRMLAELIQMSIRNKIMVSMGLNVTGASGASAATKSVTDAVMGGTGNNMLGSAGGSLLGGAGMAASSLGYGLTGSLGASTSLGLITAPGALGLSGIAAGLGGLAAAVAPFAAAAGALYGIGKYGFGIGNRWKTTAGGIELGVEDGDVMGRNYEDFKKKGGWFKSNKYKTTYSELDRQWEEFVGMQYDSITRSLKDGASMMGRDGAYVEAIMDSFNSAATKIKLDGLDGEAQQKAVSDYFRKLTNEALLKLYPEIEESIRLGEDAAAAWQRLNNLRKTNNSLLMQELELLGDKGSSKYMNFLNQQREMELLNMEESTQAIQRRIWALQDEKDALSRFDSTILDAAMSASNALASIRGGALSTGSPETLYMQSGTSLANAVADKRYADIPALATAFLEMSKSYNASGAGYTLDYNTVNYVLKDLAGMPTTAEQSLTAAQEQVQLLSDIKAAIEQGNVAQIAGFAGQLSPSSAVSSSLTDATDISMKSKATEMSSNATKMALGLAPTDMRYDIAPLGKPDGKVDGGDALVWAEIASGYFKWSDTGLPAFASGGITSGPSLAGEAGPEAVVPLPDGRSIPVRMSDNYIPALISGMEELKKEMAALKAEAMAGNRIAMAVGEQLVGQGEESIKNTSVMARNLRLAAAK